MRGPRRTPAEWAILVGEWRQTGLSLAEFCLRRDINLKTMQNWIYKPKHRRALEEANNSQKTTRAEPTKTEPKPIPDNTFIPVRILEPITPPKQDSNHSAIEISLDGGRRIVVRAGFDEETLRRVVAALEARPC
jgi:hypothetical protein